MEHAMYTEEETKMYYQTKDMKTNTIKCVTCRKTIPMTVERRLGFGIYQCSECGERENVFLKKIKG
jgi:ribosomal protein L37AE/L43A